MNGANTMKIQTHSLPAAVVLFVAVAFSPWRVAGQDAGDSDLTRATRTAPVKLRDGDRLQLTMQFQAALRAAEAELAKLDDAERARRIRAIASSVQDPAGEMAAAVQPTRGAPLASRPATERVGLETRTTADGQAQYLAEAARLRQTWPANPSRDDYARLESLKEKYLPEE
jgi:hypothetical protein